MSAPEFSEAEARKLAAIEAAPAAEESVRERVARAMYDSDKPMSEWPWAPDPVRDRFRLMADAALAVLSGPSSDAERAVERVLDFAAAYERGDIGDPGRGVVAWMMRVAVADAFDAGDPADSEAAPC